MRLGIRGKLLLLTLGMGIPLALVGVLNLGRMWSFSRTQHDDSVQQQAELAAIAFERWVDAQRQPLITIAAVLANQKNHSFETNLQYVVQTRPYWLDIGIVDAAGKTLLAQPADHEPLTPALIKFLLAETRTKSWVLITDRTHDESRPIFAIAARTNTGGAVIARIDGAAINDLFKDIQLPGSAVIAVFDSQGQILYRKQTTNTSIPTEVTSSPLFEALGDRRLAVVELRSPYDQIKRVYGLSRAGATDFVVAVGVPSATLYEPMQRELSRYVIFSVLALVCAVVAAFLIQRSIVRPVQRLTRVAQTLGEGDLTARAPNDSGGEIRELGTAFNMMAQQIKEREERLAELDRLKSEFVSSVSHELRTPLTTIKTLTHVLLRTGPSEVEQREFLETIAAECDRQIDLVTNLLDLSRIESGAYKIELSSVNVVECVANTAKLEKHAAEAHQHQLTTQLPDGPVLVKANKAVLRRILCTLVENAIKYTPDSGKITLGVSDADEEVCIYTEDNGAGISAADLPRIFERFYRGGRSINAEGFEQTIAADQPGVGLGLYLVHGLVEQLGGRITVKSEIAQGSTFSIYLPKWHEATEHLAKEETDDVEATIGS